MLIVDVFKWRSAWSSKAKVICSLAWDDQQNKIVILKGKRIGRRILKGRYLDKRWPEKEQYLSTDQGEDFIRNLCHGICGSRVWASVAYEKESK